MTIEELEQKMIARATRFGHSVAEKTALLNELKNNHDGNNLEVALVYEEFATVKMAEKYVALRECK